MVTQPSDSPTDHGWIDDHHGVLSCIAGDVHTARTIVACPYYLRPDVLDALSPDVLPPADRPRWTANSAQVLTYHGEPYHKITHFARPHHWRRLIAALPARHAAAPAAWSLLSLLGRQPDTTLLDPRTALTERINTAPAASPAARLIRTLLHALGDPENRERLLGLTGSAALDPAKLDTGTDLDLLIYPPASTAALTPLLASLDAQFLNELPAADPRLRAYHRSRIMAPLAEPTTALRLWWRRRDVCWVDGLQLDLTDATGPGDVADSVIYERAPTGVATVTVTVDAVSTGYPAVVTLDDPRDGQVVVTARGLSTGVFRAADRLRLRCSRHSSGNNGRFLSLDDAAGHRIEFVNCEDGPC